MTKATHTPGPWKAEEHFDGDESLGIAITAGKVELATIGGIAPQDFANANAMAAVPEMLAALKALIPHVLHYAAFPHAHSDADRDAASARAAIAKATSKSTAV